MASVLLWPPAKIVVGVAGDDDGSDIVASVITALLLVGKRLATARARRGDGEPRWGSGGGSSGCPSSSCSNVDKVRAGRAVGVTGFNRLISASS
jgi:hypothetical protein